MKLEKQLTLKFDTKDLSLFKHFPTIKVARLRKGIHFSQKMNQLNIYKEVRTLGSRLVEASIGQNLRLNAQYG